MKKTIIELRIERAFSGATNCLEAMETAVADLRVRLEGSEWDVGGVQLYQEEEEDGRE